MSGIYLAGAALSVEGKSRGTGDDGILTAYEVSAMDLSGVELVVLSACDTGLGSIEDGEGVYGLRRAFQYAGARAVISTLWPLDDDAMAKMVGRVYVSTDKSLPERLRSVQREMIDSLRTAGEPDHPYMWAGFTVTGTWE
jgi:CHAT domain-containing protein